MAKNPFFFFDIETGGKYATQSSILSLSTALGNQDPRSVYSDPTEGTRLYKWAEKNVWEQVKTKPGRISEENLIRGFIHQVENLPSGSTLAGWNIGYLPGRQGPSVPGFDLPFLTTRANKYGLEDKLRTAVSRHSVRDLGQEYSLRIAREVAGKGRPLVDQGILHEDLYTQAIGYVKKASQVAFDYGVDPSDDISVARAMGRSGQKYMFSGWKQEDIYKLVTGNVLEGAHQSEFDVRALQQLSGKELGEGFLERWSRVALQNKLISGAVSQPYQGADPSRYANVLQAASEMEGRHAIHSGLRESVEKGIRERVASSGGSIADVRKGVGISEGYSKVGGVLRAGGLPAFSQSELTGFLKKHRVGVGFGSLLALGYATQVGQYFSGKDDEYNTIEGLPHRGIAGQFRKQNTDFGSGYGGIFRRSFDVLSWLNSAGNRAVAHITKEIAHGARRLQPLETGVAAFTAAEIGMTAMHAAAGTLTMGGMAGTLATMVGSKYAYEAVKQRKALKGLYETYKANPKEAKLTAEVAGFAFGDQLKRYILHGERNLASTYIRAGGGEYGLQSVLARLETAGGKASGTDLASLSFAINKVAGKDDFWNIVEGLGHKGIAQQLRQAMTDFGSGWVRRAISKGVPSALIEEGVRRSGKNIISSREGHKFIQGKLLGEGSFGKAYSAQSIRTGQGAVYKELKEGKYEQLHSALKDPRTRLGPRAVGYMAREESPMAAAQLSETLSTRMITSYSGFKNPVQYEAAMHKAAHADMPDLVPAMLGQTEKGYFQEFAGRPLKESEYGEAAEFFKTLYGKMTSGKASVLHLDPDVSNVIKTFKGDLKMIDFGLAAPSKLFRSQTALEDYGELVSAATRNAKAKADRIKQAARQQQVMASPPNLGPARGGGTEVETANLVKTAAARKLKKTQQSILQRQATQATWAAAANGGRNAKKGTMIL